MNIYKYIYMYIYIYTYVMYMYIIYIYVYRQRPFGTGIARRTSIPHSAMKLISSGK